MWRLEDDGIAKYSVEDSGFRNSTLKSLPYIHAGIGSAHGRDFRNRLAGFRWVSPSWDSGSSRLEALVIAVVAVFVYFYLYIYFFFGGGATGG